MKQIFTTLVTTLFSFSLFASAPTSKLTISVISNQSISILIDGRAVSMKQKDDTYVINNLTPGYHSLKIVRAGNGGRRNNDQLLYTGGINMKRGYHTDIVINRFGKAFIDEDVLRNNYNDNDNGYEWQNESRQVMDIRSFDQLKRIISNERFDNTRMSIARQSISDNMLSALQAKQIVILFDHESNKLEMAKFIYRYTADKHNYVTVYDALTFNNSKQELARYIQQYR